MAYSYQTFSLKAYCERTRYVRKIFAVEHSNTDMDTVYNASTAATWTTTKWCHSPKDHKVVDKFS